MTIKEIAVLFGCSHWYIYKIFEETNSIHKSMAAKKGISRRDAAIDYTYEECVYAFENAKERHVTPMMLVYLEEHFIHRTTSTGKLPKPLKLSTSARTFLFYYPSYRMYKACVTCAYFNPRSMKIKGSKLNPYCSFYECFLNKVKPYRDIYKSTCPTFVWSNKVPTVWTNVGPVKVNRIKRVSSQFFLRQENEVLGIKLDKFKGKRKPNEPIILLKDPDEPVF